LVWGDQQAVFQIIANAIILAIEIEEGALLVQIRYISYEGLEIVVQGSSHGFGNRMREVIESGQWNNLTHPVAVVLRELLTQLDAQFVVVDSDVPNLPERIRVTLPLKLSES